MDLLTKSEKLTINSDLKLKKILGFNLEKCILYVVTEREPEEYERCHYEIRQTVAVDF